MKREKPSFHASIIYLALGAIPWSMSDSLTFFMVARVLQSIVSNTQVRGQRLIKVVRRVLPLTLAVATVALSVQVAAGAAELGPPLASAPRVAIPPEGATVESVTIETYGKVNENEVRRYLTLQDGSRLEQSAIDKDYANLVKLGGYRVRLEVKPGSDEHAMLVHWIVADPTFQLTAHPLYEEAPLADPTRGVGFIVAPLDPSPRGSDVSFATSQNRWAHHASATFSSPVSVNPKAGRESDLLVNVLGEDDAYRISSPQTVTVYNWTVAGEVRYLTRGTSGRQFDVGLREERSTSNRSNGIVAPSLYPSNAGSARNLLVEIGASHACPRGPNGGWYPPYCHSQYRAAMIDAIGGLGSTSTFRLYIADVAQYIPVHTSTLALHAVGVRTAGVLPASRLLCAAALRAFPEPFCGTDGSLLQAEYRIRDAATQPLKFTLFTETGSHRLRGGDQPWAPASFHWHADSGIEVRYRGVAVGVAHGSEGYRLQLALSAQSF